MDRPSELSPEHRALLRFLTRVRLDNGAKPLAAVAAAMNLKSKSRVSHLLRGTNGALPVDDAQLKALVRALGGGTDEVTRGLALYAKVRRSRAASATVKRGLSLSLTIEPPAAPPLIGRQRELDSLQSWATDLVNGRGRAVLVEGEPGIGKSSLGRAAIAEARNAGCQVFWGACDELSQMFPLRPLIDALDTTRGRPRIADLLRSSPAPDRIDPVAVATERLLALVEELCGTAPVALVVDDLQWADPATVATLGRLAKLVHRLPLLLVGLTRPVPRRRDLGALRRAVEPPERLWLESLSATDVAALVARSVQGTPGDRLLQLVATAAGNPLYVTELIDALDRARLLHTHGDRVDAVGAGAPESLSAAIADRLEFLAAPVHNLLQAAALLGVEFSVSELAVVVGRPVNELLPLLEEALVAGVLRGEGPELAFRHPLIHSVLYDRMRPALRAAWHHDAGRALAEAGAPADRVARQLLPTADAPEVTAGAAGWTARWLAEAGQDLVARAPQAAIPLLRFAMTAVPVGVVPHDLLAARLADALYRVGDATGAAEVASHAIDTLTQPELLVDLLWTLTQCRGREGRSQESLEVLRRTIASPDLKPSHRARLLVLTARVHRTLGDVETAGAVANEALAAATTAGDRWATSWALAVLTIVHSMRGESGRALPLFERALAITEGDPVLADLRLLLKINQSAALGVLDRHDEAIGIAQQVRQFASDAHNVVRFRQASSVLVELLFDAGRWDDALAKIYAHAGDSTDPAADCCDRGIAAIIGFHRADPWASQHIVDAKHLAGRLGRRVIGTFILAQSLERERAQARAEALEVLLGGLSDCGEQVESASDLFVDAVRLATSIGDETTARSLIQRAMAMAGESDVPHIRTVVLHCRGLLNNDPLLLRRAADRYAVGGRPLSRAQALEAAGMAFASSGDPAAAHSHLVEAMSIYGTLAARWDVSRIRSRLGNELGG